MPGHPQAQTLLHVHRQKINGPRRRPLGSGGGGVGKSVPLRTGSGKLRRLESWCAESGRSREAPGRGQAEPRKGGAGAGAAGRIAYRAVGAAQRHHQLRLVLVRLLRQLEGLLNRQQPLLRPHGAGTRS